MSSQEMAARAIIRLLNEEFGIFREYKRAAIELFEEEEREIEIPRASFPIGELIPKKVRKELYEIA
ncbi:MAG: hypothetical protein N4A57_02630 [Anaeromicrobium sp.]|jgi:hypothetical protein|uniref:hypothetical protein n=1 Tax=Anaeromicrobium sp. TaxID=1929132 RepID=UPI0025FE0CA3|nr:hypothetical protein [Anaeromicrobium sp.]MCT4593156.1 hypothetical protein [Anaeromicrobium sp.]